MEPFSHKELRTDNLRLALLVVLEWLESHAVDGELVSREKIKDYVNQALDRDQDQGEQDAQK